MSEIVIALNHGKQTVIDAVSRGMISPYTWRAVLRKYKDNIRWYVAGVRYEGGTREDVYMHRIIAGAKRGETVDHRDGDGLNNRRRNLRRCSVRQNVVNARVRAHSSRFKGVYRNRHGRWVAQIGILRRAVYLGAFVSEEEAARAYNQAATRHYGEFAKLNGV